MVAELQQANAAVVATLETLCRQLEHLRGLDRRRTTQGECGRLAMALSAFVMDKLDAIHSEQDRCSQVLVASGDGRCHVRLVGEGFRRSGGHSVPPCGDSSRGDDAGDDPWRPVAEASKANKPLKGPDSCLCRARSAGRPPAR